MYNAGIARSVSGILAPERPLRAPALSEGTFIMPRYKLTPLSSTSSSFEFDGLDASSALNVASRVKFREADIAQDGVYICTIRSHDDNHSGFWIVEKHSPESRGQSPNPDEPRQALRA